jgi:hypothetical protein
MNAKAWLTVLCLVLGIAMLAYGLTVGNWLLIIAGLALELTALYFIWGWMTGANRPMGGAAKIKPAANAAWSMKDEPARRPDGEDN